MKKCFRSVVFKLAVVGMIMALGVSAADAAWVTGVTKRTALISSPAAQRNAVAASANIGFALGNGESLAANDTIVITLTGGAKFTSTTPTLTPSAGDVGGGVTSAASPLSGGTAGSTSATWRVIATVASQSSFALNSSANIFDLSAVTSGTSVDISIALATSTGAVIGSSPYYLKASVASGTTIAGMYLFDVAAANSTAVTTATNTADVAATAGAYFKFLNAATAGTATGVVFTNSSNADTFPTSATISVGKLLVTLTGDFTNVTQVAATNFTGSDSTGDITSGTAGKFLINTAKTAAYAVNNIVAPVGAMADIAPTWTINGTAAQTARSFTVTVDVLTDGTTWTAHNAKAATTIYTIARNGWVGTIPYLLGGTSAADDSFVKLFNSGTTEAAVSVTINPDGLTDASRTITLDPIPAGKTVAYWANNTSNGAGKNLGQSGAFAAVFTVNAVPANVTATAFQKKTTGMERALPIYHATTDYLSW